MIYNRLIKPILFLSDPETVHYRVFGWIKRSMKFPYVKNFCKYFFGTKDYKLNTKVFGIDFSSPVGLAAGFDKDAKLIDELSCFGFGFIEVGTVTPKAQEGNPRPRLFRLPEDQALINRMGFNNEGVEAMVKRLKQRKTKVIVGGNIGKNKITPNEQAIDDYLYSFRMLFDHVDYFVVNVSSPNTPNLRKLQEKEPLTKLLNSIQKENQERSKSKPILLKIAPDLSTEQLDDIIEIIKASGLDGIIATNTTIDRSKLKAEKKKIDSIGAGGLSGVPLRDKSTDVIRYISKKSANRIPIIAVGGIFSASDAIEKLEAGASLVQIYTGFIYEGPGVVKKINRGIAAYYEKQETKTN